MQSEQIPVARESVPFLGLGVLSTLVLALLGYSVPALICLAASGFLLYFFRDPVRVLPEGENTIVSTADGRIIRVEEVADNRFLHGQALKVSIFMNLFNVHVNRIPYAGTVEAVRLQAGRFYAADRIKAELHNEYCALLMGTQDGGRYAVVQVAGLVARRIVCRAETGDQLRAGQRYGLIRFGSRLDLYLPPATAIAVQIGDRVRAGESLLGHWPVQAGPAATTS